MKTKLISFFSLLSISGLASAKNFCEQLADKLVSSNSEKRIVQKISYYHAVSNMSNFSQLVEYKYNFSDENNEDSNYIDQDSIDFDNPEHSDKVINNFSNSGQEYIKLNDCNVNGNYASFKIQRIYPALKIDTSSWNENLPEFNIQFAKYNNNWRVSSVNSYNCSSLLTQNGINNYKKLYSQMNRITNSDFYTDVIPNMIRNHVCPSHNKNLSIYFNNLIRYIK